MAIHHDIDPGDERHFDLRAAKLGETLRVTLHGEFDLAAVDAVEDALGRAYDGGTRRLELDLGPLTFLDSSGLRTIIDARERAREHGVELRLGRGNETVQRVFRMTGLEDALPFDPEPWG